ncbi:hypothetical protein [Streptomyces sp. NPDC047841]|uniref:hypothetical protein n=1 Tax=Streptomyces sp. NPDC047841 TaxID=3154708 RepID=UPI003456DC67
MHGHLEHEEPMLFPALAGHVPPESRTVFSQQVVTTAPMAAAHLTLGFFDEVGTPQEVAQILAGLPEPAQQFVPRCATRHGQPSRPRSTSPDLDAPRFRA